MTFARALAVWRCASVVAVAVIELDAGGEGEGEGAGEVKGRMRSTQKPAAELEFALESGRGRCCGCGGSAPTWGLTGPTRRQGPLETALLAASRAVKWQWSWPRRS